MTLVSADTKVFRVFAPRVARDVDLVWDFHYEVSHILKLRVRLRLEYFLSDVNSAVFQETVRARKCQRQLMPRIEGDLGHWLLINRFKWHLAFVCEAALFTSPRWRYLFLERAHVEWLVDNWNFLRRFPFIDYYPVHSATYQTGQIVLIVWEADLRHERIHCFSFPADTGNRVIPI